MQDDILDAVVKYITEDKERLESKIVKPLMSYVSDKFSLSVNLARAIACLIVLQTAILVWVVFGKKIPRKFTSL
jgi:hypothetical protein